MSPAVGVIPTLVIAGLALALLLAFLVVVSVGSVLRWRPVVGRWKHAPGRSLAEPAVEAAGPDRYLAPVSLVEPDPEPWAPPAEPGREPVALHAAPIAIDLDQLCPEEAS